MQHTRSFKIILAVITILSLTIFACGEKNGGNVELKTDIDKVSYSIGVSIGRELFQQDLGLNPDALNMAIKDILTEKSLRLTDEEMSTVMQDFQKQMIAKQEEQAKNNLAEAEMFSAENARKSSVVTLEDNLQYEVITEGTGTIPKESDTVSVHYHGTFIDGTVFDSSVERGEPLQFAVNNVIPGWSRILQLMKIGSKWKVYIPPELAYGASGPQGGIPPNKLLIFEIELLDIITE